MSSLRLEKVILFTADEILALGPAWLQILDFGVVLNGPRLVALEGLIKGLLAEHYRADVSKNEDDVTPDDFDTRRRLEENFEVFLRDHGSPLTREQAIALVRSFLPADRGRDGPNGP